MVQRQSVSFEDEVYENIDKYRRATPYGEPIPSFTKAVNILLKLGLEKAKGSHGG